MHVQGEGVLSDIFRALVTQFDPIEKSEMSIDTRPCLPNPRTPDYVTFETIGNEAPLTLQQYAWKWFPGII